MTLLWHRGPGITEHAHRTTDELTACALALAEQQAWREAAILEALGPADDTVED